MSQTTTPAQDSPELSAVITSYCEEKSLDEFYGRLSTVLQQTGRSYEIIIIDDGSHDATYARMKEIFRCDPQVHTIMRFFKNSGQLAAMTAGICYSRGRAVIFIDSDLQLAPEELPRLLEKYDEGFDLVSGYRVDRKDSLARIIPSRLANLIMRKASDSNLSDFGCTFKIYNAALLRAFELGPHKLYDTATVISTIGRLAEVPVSHFPRRHGKSGWTFSKLWKFNSDNLVNLSERPFQIIAALSGLCSMLIVGRVILDVLAPFKILGTVSNGLILNSILFVALVLISILCLIGEFTIRSYLSLKKRPLYIIKELETRGTPSAPHPACPSTKEELEAE